MNNNNMLSERKYLIKMVQLCRLECAWQSKEKNAA